MFIPAYMLDQTDGRSRPRLTGRTYDLKSAYKQFGVDKWHADRLRIAVKRPEGGVGIFAALALPFGASGSVSSLLRVAASLTYIRVVALQVLWTSFFDDYTCVCAEGEETNVSFYIRGVPLAPVGSVDRRVWLQGNPLWTILQVAWCDFRCWWNT